MRKELKLSRRAIVSGLVVTPAVSVKDVAPTMYSPDAKLIALYRQHQSTPDALQRAATLDEMDAIVRLKRNIGDEITVTPAKTLEGLCVKARCVLWMEEWEGPKKQNSIHSRILASIIRDLMELGPSIFSP